MHIITLPPRCTSFLLGRGKHHGLCIPIPEGCTQEESDEFSFYLKTAVDSATIDHGKLAGIQHAVPFAPMERTTVLMVPNEGLEAARGRADFALYMNSAGFVELEAEWKPRRSVGHGSSASETVDALGTSDQELGHCIGTSRGGRRAKRRQAVDHHPPGEAKLLTCNTQGTAVSPPNLLLLPW